MSWLSSALKKVKKIQPGKVLVKAANAVGGPVAGVANGIAAGVEAIKRKAKNEGISEVQAAGELGNQASVALALSRPPGATSQILIAVAAGLILFLLIRK